MLSFNQIGALNDLIVYEILQNTNTTSYALVPSIYDIKIFQNPKMEGTLSKWTNVMKGWQYRWFVLDENAGLFSYYTRNLIKQ